MFRNLIQQLWNFDLARIRSFRLPVFILTIFVVGLAIIYPVGEVLFGGHPALSDVSLLKFRDDIATSSWDKGFRAALPKVWLYIAIFAVLFRISIIIHSYFKSRQTIGDQAFTRQFLTYFPSFMLGILITAVLFLFVNLSARILGWDGEMNTDVVVYWITSLHQWVDTHIPSLLNIGNYWLALVITIFVAALPGYFMHTLCHKSRFFWYFSHRAHHVPEFMHPLAVPDAFYFNLPLTIFKGFVAIVVSKLVHTQPLVMEMTIWFTLSHIAEIFNHSIIHYDLALKNPIIRNYSRLFGEFGVYHLMHHSAKPEDHTINLSGAPFLFWDRVFGTYRKPYDEAPPIGLSNQPEIRMNPFRIVFGGIAQLGYEWKMNKDWRTRFKIIFGSIWYKPPVTKDFLIVEKNIW